MEHIDNLQLEASRQELQQFPEYQRHSCKQSIKSWPSSNRQDKNAHLALSTGKSIKQNRKSIKRARDSIKLDRNKRSSIKLDRNDRESIKRDTSSRKSIKHDRSSSIRNDRSRGASLVTDTSLGTVHKSSSTLTTPSSSSTHPSIKQTSTVFDRLSTQSIKPIKKGKNRKPFALPFNCNLRPITPLIIVVPTPTRRLLDQIDRITRTVSPRRS